MEESNSSQHTKQTWSFRREQAQADINRLLGYLKKYEDVRSQIRFLQRCNRNRLIPKGLRSTLSSLQNSQSSNDRFCRKIHFRLLRRTIRNKYYLLSEIDNNIKIYSWNLNASTSAQISTSAFKYMFKNWHQGPSQSVNTDYDSNFSN